MKQQLYWIVMIPIVFLLFGMNLLTGSVSIPFREVLTILTGGEATRPTWNYIVMETRLPQALTAMLCGGALATSGLLLQTAFRNPLAGPGIFGITNGAALGVALVMLGFGGGASLELLPVEGFMAVVVSAFIGAMAVMGLLLLFSTMVKNHIMLLIVGMMTGYLSSAVISMLNYMATEEGVRSYMMWGMGSFSGVSMRQIPYFIGLVIVGLSCALLLVKPLNAWVLGNTYARNLGVNTRRLSQMLLMVTGLLCAVTTAFCGPVAFIGLAVPHIARLLLVTENHRVLMPATVLMGAAVALLCNWLCYLPADGNAIPLNTVTPLVGVPVIVYVILRK